MTCIGLCCLTKVLEAVFMNYIQTKKNLATFFRALFFECQKDRVYSVIETVESIGIDYAQVQEWAQLNEHWKNILQDCRDLCACHAEEDGLCARIPSSQALKYMYENNDEFKRYQDTLKAFKAKQRKLNRSKKKCV